MGALSFVEFLMAYVTMGTPRFVPRQVGRKLALHRILKTLVKFPAVLGERNRTEIFVREGHCLVSVVRMRVVTFSALLRIHRAFSWRARNDCIAACGEEVFG